MKMQNKEIFLAVIGTTPQILTECLYYYYSPFYNQKRFFNKIKVITTLEGEKKLVEKILMGGILKKLSQSLEIAAIPFTRDDIIVLHDYNGRPIKDLRSTDDNFDSLLTMFRVVQELSSDPCCRLTATVAGGRKTMSAMMALAFQIYGREKDELIHIIASDERMNLSVEGNADWFFPDNPADPTQRLDVSLFPIIKIGRYIGLDIKMEPRKLVEKIQERIISRAPIRELRIRGREFYSGQEKLILPPKRAAYLRYFIKRKKDSTCQPGCEGCEMCFSTRDRVRDAMRQQIKEEYRITSGDNSGYYQNYLSWLRKYRDDVLLQTLDEDLVRLRQVIRNSQKISERFKRSIQIENRHFDQNNLKSVWYGVTLDPSIVTFEK